MPQDRGIITAVILDIDGVVVDSPHERAWRDALEGLADPERLTLAVYQAYVAGKPRLAGARALLNHLSVPDADRLAGLYAERKQNRLQALIDAGEFTAFPDAIRFLRAVRQGQMPLAAASSSKNANAMLARIALSPDTSLLNAFHVNVCGEDFARGKPDPQIFLTAAERLGVAPTCCLVVEDAPSGIEAAKRGRMLALGIGRHGESSLLQATGADFVVANLDEVSVDALVQGRLSARRG
jgi:beta-phosphoglucomutase